MPNENTFVKITNEQIYKEIVEIKKTINGNGKTGLKTLISNNTNTLKVHSGILFLLIGALIGGAIGGFF